MKTINIDSQSPCNEKNIFKRIKQELEKNSVILMPTDTIYGLLVKDNVLNEKKLVFLKGRPPEKAFIRLLGHNYLKNNFKKLQNELCAPLSSLQKEILQNNWPSSITFILPDKNNSTLALRLPDTSSFLGRFLKDINFPILAPSANFSGIEYSNNISLFVKDLNNYPEKEKLLSLYISKSNDNKSTKPSPIIDLSSIKSLQNIKVLRGSIENLKL